MNYITVLGYPEHADFKNFWPANVQVIGKDIIRFHAAIWPAMLFSLGLPLPKMLYVHGFINIDNQKMSKSLGNYISPNEVIDKFGVDAFRYFFLRHIPSYNDGDFNWEIFEKAYNSELADELGNAVQRTMAMIQQYQAGVIGTTPAAEHDTAAYEAALAACRFDRALDEVWEQVRGLNQYIDEEKPWVVAKENDADHLREVLAYQVSALLEIAELLSPFLPETATKIKAIFGTGVVQTLTVRCFRKPLRLTRNNSAMKIAVITCYDQNDYIRARTLRTAFAAVPGVDVKIIRNRLTGFLRYIEVPLKILTARLFGHIDAYVITFRGYEMLPFTLLVKGSRPLIFDELVNAVEYLQEHSRITMKSMFARWFVPWYSRLLKGCRFVLADTAAHAIYSAELSHLPADTFRVIPVAADENYFYPEPTQRRPTKQPFRVFYYGNAMTPLHGLRYVLDAAVKLKQESGIVFQIIGGHEAAAAACTAAATKGAHIEYEAWVAFEELADRARAADLCLGGPFGKTLQSQFVVTGKTTQFMACAKPVLVGHNLAQSGFVDRRNCLSVPQADAKAITDAILWASKHRPQLKKIGGAGRQLYERRFSQRVVDRAVRDLTRELA